jgi:hypothetical protein
VIELVGTRSVPADAAAQLLTSNWQRVLGTPQVFCMAASDIEWRRLSAQSSGSYDSLALCWDILSERGQLTNASASHLFRQSERFAEVIGRRAMPMPVPGDISKVAHDLTKIQEQLDVGVSLAVIQRTAQVSERDLWVICSKLGLQFFADGSFDWRVPQHPSPLLSVTPIGDVEAFSLGAVQKGAIHEGVTVGFSVPRCPAPSQALEGAFHVADAIATHIDGVVIDDSSRVLTAEIKSEMRNSLSLAEDALKSLNIEPGSPSCLKLF